MNTYINEKSKLFTYTQATIAVGEIIRFYKTAIRNNFKNLSHKCPKRSVFQYKGVKNNTIK